MDTLTKREATRLDDLESVVRRGLSSFVAVGTALCEIRERRLYRAEHPTFEHYCRSRWGLSRIHGHRLIAAAETMQMLPTGNAAPVGESQVRPLVALPAEDRPAAWGRAVKLAGGSVPTARHVQRAVEEHLLSAPPENVQGAKTTEPVTRCGDTWILGEHRLACGDATNLDDVGRAVDGRDADLILTSPPYNVGANYDGYDDRQPDAAYVKMIRQAVASAASVLGDGRFVAWNVGTMPTTGPHRHAAMLEAVGLTYRRQIAWDKVLSPFPVYQHAAVRHPTFDCQHEILWFFSNGEPARGGPIADAPGVRCSSDVWRVHLTTHAPKDLATKRYRRTGLHNGSSKSHAVKAHPAAMPLALAVGVVSHLTERGETVLDPFGGSGTTLIACERLGRRARLVEISPAYCDLVVTRWEKLTGRKATREKGRKRTAAEPLPLGPRNQSR